MRAPTSSAQSPFPWFGGKQRLAKKIAALLPPHDVYCEVFGGGASVLFAKPKSQLEIYNDLDDGLVLFFRVLRDRPEELVPLLMLTPYSRSEFDDCRRTWSAAEDELERARRWYAMVAQSYAAHAVRDNGSGGRGWGAERLGRMHLARGESSANRVDHIWRFVERLRGVQIENLDWREFLDRYDSPAACFYLDPPYVPATRRAGGYVHELTLADHVELVDRLLALEGAAIVSGYDHGVYEPLEAAGYRRVEWDVWSTAAPRQASIERHGRVEVVWIHPSAPESTPTLFAEAGA